MNINNLKTQKIDWKRLPEKELKGENGSTKYKEITSGGYRVRLAEYSANYSSAEWCDKGHVLHCVSGTFTLHLKNGGNIVLNAGGSILIGSADPHMATTGNEPAVLFIIDNE